MDVFVGIKLTSVAAPSDRRLGGNRVEAGTGRVRPAAFGASRRGHVPRRRRGGTSPSDSGRAGDRDGPRAHLLVGVHRALRRNFDLHQGTVRLEGLAEQLALLVSHLRDLGLCASRETVGGIGSVGKVGTAAATRIGVVAATRGGTRGEAGGRPRGGLGHIIFVPTTAVRNIRAGKTVGWGWVGWRDCARTRGSFGSLALVAGAGLAHGVPRAHAATGAAAFRPVLLRLHRIVPAGLSRTGGLCVSCSLGVRVVALGLLGLGLVRGRRGSLALPAHRVFNRRAMLFRIIERQHACLGDA